MERFLSFDPLDYRYIARDKELLGRLKSYGESDVLTKISRIVPESSLPRLHSLENQLRSISEQNKTKIVPKRVDGMHAGTTTVGEVFRGYADSLYRRIKNIETVPLDLSGLEAVELNERLSDLVYHHVLAAKPQVKLSHDVRQLFRDEIGQYSHADYPEDRVGSSTMPHKKNPVEYEMVISLMKVLSASVPSALMSVVEHEGDSTNDYLPGLTFWTIAGVNYITGHLSRTLKNLKINVK